jgi:hypothetical protein
MTPYASRRFRRYDDEDEETGSGATRERHDAGAGFARWGERLATLRASGMSPSRRREYDDECD